MLLTDERVDRNYLTAYGPHKITALTAAATNGHTEVLEVLLADGRVDPNKGDGNGESALICAASVGELESAALLLTDERVNPNMVDDEGNSALNVAAMYNHASMVTLLLADQRVNPNMIDYYGDTLLRTAVEYKDAPMVTSLLHDPRIVVDDISAAGIFAGCRYLFDWMTQEVAWRALLLRCGLHSQCRLPMDSIHVVRSFLLEEGLV